MFWAVDAAATCGSEIDVVLPVVTVVGGLALFLFAMSWLTDALGLVADERIVSPRTHRMLEEFHAAIRTAFEDAIIAVTEGDREAVDRVGSMKQTINAMERSIQARQVERLVVDESHRLETSRLETDLVADLERISYPSKRTASAAAPVDERPTT